MADVTIKYKDGVVAEMNESGITTLDTAGKYCEGDVIVEYTAKETGLTNVKRWDITLDGTVSGYTVRLFYDDWLLEHRDDPNLCVMLMPKFTIPHSADVSNQGIIIHSNSSFISDSSNALYFSISAYTAKSGTVAFTKRSKALNAGNDIGNLIISQYGVLSALVAADFPFAAGEYVVFAFLL